MAAPAPTAVGQIGCPITIQQWWARALGRASGSVPVEFAPLEMRALMEEMRISSLEIHISGAELGSQLLRTRYLYLLSIASSVVDGGLERQILNCGARSAAALLLDATRAYRVPNRALHPCILVACPQHYHHF
eukprot:4233490-Pleurochrysis_carterae.AAC.2